MKCIIGCILNTIAGIVQHANRFECLVAKLKPILACF